MIYTSEKPLLKYFPKVCYCGNTIFHKYTNKNEEKVMKSQTKKKTEWDSNLPVVKISGDIHLKFKIKCVKEGVSMSDIIRTLVQKYVEDDLNDSQ